MSLFYSYYFNLLISSIDRPVDLEIISIETFKLNSFFAVFNFSFFSPSFIPSLLPTPIRVAISCSTLSLASTISLKYSSLLAYLKA